MQYSDIEKAVFISRPNRFIAEVETAAGAEVCHVKSTGRCRELLIPGAEVYVQRTPDPRRKTALDLISVVKNGRIINIDSASPNKVMYDYIAEGRLFGGACVLKREVTYGKSRIDLYAEKDGKRHLIEVKGVTLFEGGAALFPDAPTERGIKHLIHLSKAVSEGYASHIVFVIQAKGASYFSPNEKTHKAFADALRAARKAGVEIIAVDCVCTPDSIVADSQVEVRL